MVNTRGFTLVELIIAVALSGIAALAVASLLVANQTATLEATRRQDNRADLSISLIGFKKEMPASDSTFWAFSGISEKPVIRLLLPQPQKCRDLSKKGCEADTSFVFVNSDTTLSPSLTNLCKIENGGQRFAILDARDPSLGLTSFSAGKFTVDSTTSGGGIGEIEIKPNTVLSFGIPPSNQLWIAASTPLPVAAGDITASDADCLPRANDVGDLYKVTLVPLAVTQFTGGTDLSGAWPSLSGFPMRLSIAELRSIGRMPGSTSDATGDFGINRCKVSFNSNRIDCTENIFIHMRNARRVRMLESFSANLSPAQANLYEVHSSAMTKSDECVTPACTSLLISDPDALKALATNAEQLTTLQSAEFSLIKQEVIDRLRIEISFDENGTHRNSGLDVYFR